MTGTLVIVMPDVLGAALDVLLAVLLVLMLVEYWRMRRALKQLRHILDPTEPG